MTREIKFRAWDKKNKVMLSDGASSTSDIYYPWGFQTDRSCSPSDLEIMQFTGLSDKNDKEIYEKCDILHFGLGNHLDFQDTVEFGWSSNNEYGLIWSKSKNIVTDQDGISERMEVIGNIYENPELLQ